VISGFPREKDEICALLGYYADTVTILSLNFLTLEDRTDR